MAGALLAAFCCAGTAWIIAGLTAAGLGFLRKDAILWPMMLASLLVALWGFWRGRSQHGSSLPLAFGGVGAVLLATGVIFVHGPPAMAMIYTGSTALLLAVVLNLRARRLCDRRGAV